MVVHRCDASDGAVVGGGAARPRSILPVSKIHRSSCPPSSVFTSRSDFLASTSSPAAAGDATIPILTISDPHECPAMCPEKQCEASSMRHRAVPFPCYRSAHTSTHLLPMRPFSYKFGTKATRKALAKFLEASQLLSVSPFFCSLL